ncbi:serine hydrolase domain-containing protein [Tessaracoccus sp. G1721]
MRRWVVRVVVGVVVVALAAGTAGYWYARPLLLTGTGYAAHNACALTHLADRPAGDDLPPNPLVPYLRTSTTDDGARTTVLGALAAQRAWYADGFGCTLADAAPDLGEPTPISPNALTSAPAPAPSPEIDAAVGRAFGDDLDAAARDELGTRAVVVLHDGELVAERYADGFTAATPQLGWSMAKSVANLLTGVLVEKGSVAVDDAALRPEWTDARRDITVDHLMRGTSGLEWDETYDLGTPITRMLYLEEDMAGYVAGLPSAHAPGTYQQYSSGGTNLLCSVLTERAGVGADLPRRELLAPLGLSSAVWEADATGLPVCSSYLWATPRDWAGIGQFALQDGVWEGARMLPEGWMADSTTVTEVAESEEEGYAAGWWVNQLPDGSLVDESLPADAYSANGHDGQRLYVVPSAGLVVVRMGFSPGVPREDLRVGELVAELVSRLG